MTKRLALVAAILLSDVWQNQNEILNATHWLAAGSPSRREYLSAQVSLRQALSQLRKIKLPVFRVISAKIPPVYPFSSYQAPDVDTEAPEAQQLGLYDNKTIVIGAGSIPDLKGVELTGLVPQAVLSRRDNPQMQRAFAEILSLCISTRFSSNLKFKIPEKQRALAITLYVQPAGITSFPHTSPDTLGADINNLRRTLEGSGLVIPDKRDVGTYQLVYEG